MIKIILIYGLSLFLGILASGLSLLALMPIAVVVRKYKSLKFPFAVFTGLVGGLLCFSIGGLFFHWFNIELTFWLLLFYVVLNCLNASGRFKRQSADKVLEWGWLLGETTGFISSAFLFGLFK